MSHDAWEPCPRCESKRVRNNDGGRGLVMLGAVLFFLAVIWAPLLIVGLIVFLRGMWLTIANRQWKTVRGWVILLGLLVTSTLVLTDVITPLVGAIIGLVIGIITSALKTRSATILQCKDCEYVWSSSKDDQFHEQEVPIVDEVQKKRNEISTEKTSLGRDNIL